MPFGKHLGAIWEAFGSLRLRRHLGGIWNQKVQPLPSETQKFHLVFNFNTKVFPRKVGQIKIKDTGGSGGHNGVNSIIEKQNVAKKDSKNGYGCENKNYICYTCISHC